MKHLLFYVVVVFVACAWAQDPSLGDKVNMDIASLARGHIALNASISESLKAKVEKLVFLKNGELLAKGVLKEHRWFFSWDTTQTPDGKYQIIARAITAEKQVDSSKSTVEVDNSAPELKILPMRQKGTDVLISASAIDKGCGVDFVEMALEQQKPQPGVLLDGFYTWTLDNPIESTAIITALDKAGNQAQKKTFIRLDIKGPAILQRSFFLTPVKNPLVCEFEIDDPAGVKSVEIRIEGHPKLTPEITSEDIVYRATWGKLPQGKQRIIVTALDTLGNANDFSIVATIDDTPPTLDWSTLPQISAQPIPISIKASDSSGISEVVLLANEQATIIAPENGAWQINWRPQQDGRYTLKLQAKDVAGNIAESVPVTIVYDSTSPQGDLTLPEREYFNGQFVASVVAKDELSGVERVVFSIGKREVEAKLVGDSFSASIEMETSGSFQISGVIYDRAGNICKLVPRTVAVDRNPPVVEFMNNFPLILRDKLQVSLEARDDFSGIAEIIMTVAGKELCRLENPELEPKLDLDLSSFEEGSYPLIIMAEDRAGNKINREIGAVLVDRTPPKITAKKLSESISKGMVRIKVSWQDGLSGVNPTSAKLFLKIAEKSYPFQLKSTASGCEGKLLVSTDCLKKGGEVYLVSLCDSAGNVASKKLLGKIECRETTGNSDYALTDKLLIAYLALVFLALVVVLATRKSVYR